MAQSDLSEADAAVVYDGIRLSFKKHDPPRSRKLPEVPKRLTEVCKYEHCVRLYESSHETPKLC